MVNHGFNAKGEINHERHELHERAERPRVEKVFGKDGILEVALNLHVGQIV
jgi:hypothetical protein